MKKKKSKQLFSTSYFFQFVNSEKLPEERGATSLAEREEKKDK